ncbi:DNA-3-methyladenine glycosylase I [Breznakia sp. PF5-3]|uniref:DNA-3-methyladenine glycosylase I n=1 Tax=unclassified Breznakia TaxID=2623764 RepID=UPI0024058131|nr:MULTISPECIES: DNA-3-methyladenine glycosylase I [unclassified Breznakia]MDF9824211.1 DNA-3-methyladenine glycosylase I [Breznakia sp. PM6-1]MDF9835009.1 DNA-3-methyladenine glycosylase I [Breznakia sp. PF5-3]MDF9837254.1 DNA-3-methyladenine glycosylase I [Breznakia sp. PFB2-8]MDF9859244.1 DNA-3-methyladenine glycosylase I [Breznakia sp. PH5-24]
MKRCNWANDEAMHEYHDKEWGKPVYDDHVLFEFLVLEGMQAGLSWDTILKRRETMRIAFDNFDPKKIKAYGEAKVEQLMQDKGVIRHRLKLESLKINAEHFIEIQEEYGSFHKFLWSFVDNKPIVNSIVSMEDTPVVSKEAEALSKALRKRGFKFVGPTICYAYMQAMGLVNDHENDCDWK